MTAINAKSSTQDGLNPHLTVIDELHAHKDRSLFDVLRSATGARKNPLGWYITTAGYNSQGVCFEQRDYLCKILQGVVDDDTHFGVVYSLDEGDDPFNEAVWPKANPNLAVSVDIEKLRSYAKQAKASPASAGEFKTKRLNLWQNSHSTWLSVEQWKACGDATLKIEEFAGEPINLEWSADVRFGAHKGLKSDIAPCPKSARSRRHTLTLHVSSYHSIHRTISPL